MMLSIEELKKALRESVVEIKFIKKDGTERVIFGTTNSNLVAPTSGSGKNKSIDNPDLIVVTDIGLDEWRSFRYDQIVDILSIDSNLDIEKDYN